MRSILEYPQGFRRRLYQPDVFNPKNKSLLELREFFNEIDRVKASSKTPKRPLRHQTPQKYPITPLTATHNSRQRKSGKPLPLISFKGTPKPSTRPNSRPRRPIREQTQNPPKQTQQPPQQPPALTMTIQNYYKRYLGSGQPSPKVSLDTKDICLSISRMGIPELYQRIRRRSEGTMNNKKYVLNSSKREKGTNQQNYYFGKYDTPWDASRSREL